MDTDSRILRNAGIKENEPENLDEGIGSKMLGLVGMKPQQVGTMPRVPGSVPTGANLDPFWGAFSTGLQGLLTNAKKFEDSRDRQSYIELMKSYDEMYKLNVPDKISPLGRKLLELLGASKKAYISQQSGLDYIDKIADTLGLPDIQSKLFMGEDEISPPQNPTMGENPTGTKFDHYDFTIGTHFLPVLINNDPTGFSYNDQDGKEEAALDKFTSKLPPAGHWSYESGDEGYFGKDQVTGMMGQVIDVKYYFDPNYKNPTIGEDKPSPAPAQKKRVLPKRPSGGPKVPAKRPNDDNIAGMYKELNRQIWDNAEKSMKKPS